MAQVIAPLAVLGIVTCLTTCERFPRPGTLPPPPTTCGAEKIGPLIGQPAAGTTPGQVQRLTGAGIVVFETPGFVVNTRGKIERINIRVDEDGVIRSAWCG